MQLGVGLHSRNLVVKDTRKLAVRLAAGATRAGDISAIFAIVSVRAGRVWITRTNFYDRIQVGVNDFLAFEDREHGIALARTVGELGVIVDDGLSEFGSACGCGFKSISSHLGSIPRCALRLYIDCAKQAEADLSSISFATGRTRHGIEEIAAFLFCVPDISLGFSGHGERGFITSDIGAVRLYAANFIQPVYVHGSMTSRGVLRVIHHTLTGGWLGDDLLSVGRLLQQVGEGYFEAIALVHAQHQRPRPFVEAQTHVARQL